MHILQLLCTCTMTHESVFNGQLLEYYRLGANRLRNAKKQMKPLFIIFTCILFTLSMYVYKIVKLHKLVYLTENS